MSEHEEARQALKNADKAARQGDLAAAERWSKTAERMAAAAARLADNPPPQDEEDEAANEARRAELRRRLAAYVEADLEIQAWDEEKAAYDNACAEARATGAPLPSPLRPNPAGPNEAAREAYFTSILKEGET